MTSYNGQALEYDAIGNPETYRDGITMTWQNGRELANFTNSDTSENYTYDVSGLRTSKTVTQNGTTTEYTYVYENGLLLQMTRGSRVYDFSYDANGTPVSIAYRTRATATPSYYYYGTNSRGDVVALYTSSGTVSALYDYDAYGKLLGVTTSAGIAITGETSIAIVNPLRYRGYVYDTETELYYLQSRYYDPTTCRFINADGQLNTNTFTGYNQFAYCDNKPVMYLDPNGMCMQAWSAGYQGPCPGLGKPGCLDYILPESESTFPPLRDVTEEVNDALLPEGTKGMLINVGENQLHGLERQVLEVGTLLYFKSEVDHKANWDIKRQESWEKTIGTPYPGESTIVIYNGLGMIPEQIGNYTYGYLGRCYGYSLPLLHAGSYYAAGFPISGTELQNEICSDWYFIILGYFGVCSN